VKKKNYVSWCSIVRASIQSPHLAAKRSVTHKQSPPSENSFLNQYLKQTCASLGDLASNQVLKLALQGLARPCGSFTLWYLPATTWLRSFTRLYCRSFW